MSAQFSAIVLDCRIYHLTSLSSESDVACTY